MKITGIDIGEYRQFKNIKFDFTYPADHPTKAGQPLDKVCFIGQSGTGKTTLLNVIWDFLSTLAQATVPHEGPFGSLAIDQRHLPYKLSEVLYQVKYKVNLNNNIAEFDRSSVGGDINDDLLNRSYVSDWIKSYLSFNQKADLMIIEKYGILIRDSIAQDADAFLVDQETAPQYFTDFIKTDTEIEQEKIKKVDRIKLAGLNRAIGLGERRSMDIWRYILKDIFEYDEMGKNFAKNIVSEINSSVSTLIDKLVEWKKNTTNPRIKLAEDCLNPLLKYFFLEMETESAEVPVVMKTKQGVKIDSKYLSTGTRQLLSTAIPIYKLDTTNTVILFDEPERSLFPDIQRILINYYTSLAPEAQFFFATHSPIIASAFEPCERFILYFNENGEVDFHNGVAPEGDDPNDILRQDFDMAELMLQKGLEAYNEYRRLAMQIRVETDEAKKNQLIAERLELGNRYNFAGQYAQNR